jgi:hypothetical protein
MTELYDPWGLRAEGEIERAMRWMIEHPLPPEPSTSTGDRPMTRFLKIDPDGTCTELDVTADDLKALQEAVGGTIERVPLNGGIDMYVNEDGKLYDLERNLVAQVIVNHAGTRLLPGDHIVGTVMLFGGIDDDGDELDVPQATIDWLKRSQFTRFPDA